MRKRKVPLSDREFRKMVESISKSVHFHGCETEEDVRAKIRDIIKMFEERYESTNPVFKTDRAKFKRGVDRWRALYKGFPDRLIWESQFNPHPVYKKILGMDDEVYNMWVEEKREAEWRLAEYTP